MREVGAAGGLVLVAVAALLTGRGLPFGGIAAPGPGFFPLGLAGALAAVAVLLLGRALLAGAGPAGAPPAPGARTRLVAVVAALFAFTALFESIGFLAATFLLMVVLFRVVEGHRWLVAAAESAASALAGHVLFKVWLGVRLPPGPWGF